MKIELPRIHTYAGRLKAAGISLLLGPVLVTTAGCRKTQEKAATAPAIPAPLPVAPPTKEVVVAPKFKIMNNDSEFDSLLGDYRKLDGWTKTKDEEWLKSFVLTYSVNYKTQKEKRDKDWQAKVNEIEEKTKNMAEQFRKLTQEKERKALTLSIPEIKPNDFLSEAKLEFGRRVDSFMERNKDNYFQFATYEFCMPEHKLCFFSIKKSNIFQEYTKELRKFSTPFTPNLFRLAGKAQDLGYSRINNDNIYGISGYHSPNPYYDKGKIDKVIDYMKRSPYKNYTQDWLDLPNELIGEKIFDRPNDSKLAMAVEIPFEVMNEVISSSDNTWKNKIQELTDKQMAIGGESYRGPATGTLIEQKYNRDEVNNYMTSFLRRNSIFIIARGNPFKMEISEAYLMVSGLDKYFIKFPLAGKK